MTPTGSAGGPSRSIRRPTIGSPSCGCPVLMVAGGLDFGNTAWSAMRVASAAPNARAEVWPDVAHMIGMEQPDRLAAAIVAFLAPLERWT